MTIEYADPKQLPPDGRAGRFVGLWATKLWHAVAGIAIPIGIGIAAAMTMAPMLGYIFGLFAALLLFVAARTSQLARRRRGLIILSHLDTAVRMNLPLANTLRSWRDAESPKVAKLLTTVADRLESGGWVTDALAIERIGLSQRTIDRAHAGERAGRLSESIARVLEDERREHVRDPNHTPFVRLYAIFLLIAIPAAAAVIAIFVMPKYERILVDFKIPPPPAMRMLASVTTNVAPLLAALGVLLFMVASQVAVAEITSAAPRPWARPMRWLIDRARWNLPVLHRLDRDCGLADVCQTIADALEAHRPIDHAVADAAHPHLNGVLARRVQHWADGLSRGLLPGEAAASARLPPMLCAMLGRTRDVPNLAAVLRFLARYYDSRFGRLQALLHESALPVMAFVGGAFVVLLALSVFQPMMRMIETISTTQVRP